MRRALILLMTLCMLCSMAMAIEPSTIVVTKDGKAYYKHKVERGQTLYALSKAYNVSEEQIAECNDGLTAENLKAGSYIIIPRVEKTAVEATDGDNERVDDGKQRGKYTTYTVKRGDTIYSIARKYKISVAVLEQDNPSIDVERITPGMKLVIRRAESGYATTEDIEREREKRSAEVKLGANEHRVTVGETVYSLSRRYGISEEQFMELNNMRRSNDLKAGMIVKTAVEATPVEGGADDVAPAEQTTAETTVEADDEAIVDSLAAQRAYDYFMSGEQDSTVYVAPAEVTFLPLGRRHTLRMALMLPFHQNGRVSPQYVDFYRGVLMAMEELKAEEYNIELSVFDTEGDSTRLGDIVAYEDGFHEAQLIIGPVYEAELRYVLSYAEENDIPVVSPLADIEKLQSPVLFQMQAENDYKYDKLTDIFDGSREIVTIYAGEANNAFSSEYRELAAQVPRRNINFVFNRESFFYVRNADGTNGEEVDITALMRSHTPKAFVIVASDEINVDRILTTLSSTKSSIEGRGMTYGDYVVMGNRRWAQSGNIDHQSFFRNNVIFVVPYHAKRSDERIRLFDGRYIAKYGVLPSMYAYRGYDAAMIFCRKMFTGIDATMLDESFTPLATTYNFDFVDGLYVNTRWVREQYKSNFTIEVQ